MDNFKAVYGRIIMTRHEFADLIDFGNDIMFEVDGKSFSIIGSADGGVNIAEQITEENEAVFQDGKSLLENYHVNGRSLSECFDQIVITHCT